MFFSREDGMEPAKFHVFLDLQGEVAPTGRRPWYDDTAPIPRRLVRAMWEYGVFTVYDRMEFGRFVAAVDRAG